MHAGTLWPWPPGSLFLVLGPLFFSFFLQTSLVCHSGCLAASAHLLPTPSTKTKCSRCFSGLSPSPGFSESLTPGVPECLLPQPKAGAAKSSWDLLLQRLSRTKSQFPHPARASVHRQNGVREEAPPVESLAHLGHRGAYQGPARLS